MTERAIKNAATCYGMGFSDADVNEVVLQLGLPADQATLARVAGKLMAAYRGSPEAVAWRRLLLTGKAEESGPKNFF